MENENCLELTLTSFYFILITISTVGYGDISPVNNIERMLIIIITIFSCGKKYFNLNILILIKIYLKFINFLNYY